MRVPSDIQTLVDDGLAAMYAHPEHHYDWRRRRNMYRYMHDHYGKLGHEVHGWLAVLAAEQVLPIFIATFPEDSLPDQLVRRARQFMQKVPPAQCEAVDELQEAGYQATGIDCMTWRSTIAYNAEYAGNAAYKALLEACGIHHLLNDTEQLIWGQCVQQFHLPQNMTPDEVTDCEIAHLAAFCDTAGTAAIAMACTKEQFHLDHDRLKAFWEWWTTTAMIEAWAHV